MSANETGSVTSPAMTSESPVAKALLGAAAGSEVEVLTPTGNITWLVNKIGA